MRCVFKYELSYPSGTVGMPRGATLLHVALQRDTFCCWALVDPDAPTVPRRIMVIPTGAPVPDGGEYVGTLGVHDYSLVFHVFDYGEP